MISNTAKEWGENICTQYNFALATSHLIDMSALFQTKIIFQWGGYGSDQGLFLALYSEVIPGGVWETLWCSGDGTRVLCLEGKPANLSISTRSFL